MKKIIFTILLSNISMMVFSQSITLDPKSTSQANLLIKGDMALQKITRFTGNGGFQAANRNDASILIFENGGDLTGIAAGYDGLLVYVLCGYGSGAGALVIRHESLTETTTANRILTQTGSDFTISDGKGGVLMIYDGTKARWRIVDVTSGGGAFSGWGLSGNSGTNPASNAIGTTDVQPLVVKTNNIERMRVSSAGNVGIGTTSADTKLEVYGDFSLSKNIDHNITAATTINNLNLEGSAFHTFSGPGGISVNATITGIAGGTIGKIVILTTIIGATIVLKYLDNRSLNGNTIWTIGGRSYNTTIWNSNINVWPYWVLAGTCQV